MFHNIILIIYLDIIFSSETAVLWLFLGWLFVVKV